MVSCAFLKQEGNHPGCRVYRMRPTVCRMFPIDARDLADRDLLMPDHPCGFWFAPEGAEDADRPGFLDLTHYDEIGAKKEVGTHAQ